MKMLALTGLPGVGKDTIADHLCSVYGFHAFAFADPVRRAALAINPWIFVPPGFIDGCTGFVKLVELVHRFGWTAAKRVPEVRELLQKIGTEAGRDIHGEDCWITVMSRSLSKLVLSADARVVLTDVRFPNEDQFRKDYGAKLIRVTGPCAKPNAHRSNSYDLAADYTMHNEQRSLDALYSTVDAFMQNWLLTC